MSARAESTDGDVPLVWRPGDVILDLYEVLEVVEGGGMGLVSRVRHRGWNVEFAVKTPRPEIVASAAQLRDFEAEAEAWVRLGLHPHTVSCAYVRRLGGVPRVFAEWVDGGSLADWVRDRRLYEGGPHAALERILDVAIQCAWGIDHAHARGLIHQDVKPANVMLGHDGVVKVTDFGLARARAAAGETALPGVSLSASFGGMTRAYCSPEQAAGAALAPGQPAVRLTRATDVWSWALSVLELFMGRRACDFGQAAGEAFAAFVDAGQGDRQLPPLPPKLVSVLGHCFVLDPAGRPASMGQLAESLIEAHEAAIGAPYPRAHPQAASLLADGLSNHALSLLDLGHAERAGELLDRAVQADPHDPQAVYNRGLLRWRGARTTDDTLVAQLENVCASHPDAWAGPYLLALVHLERGDAGAARDRLELALRRAPGNPEVIAAIELAPAAQPPVTGLEYYPHPVLGAAMSADGHVVVTSCRDGLLVWDPRTGSCVRALRDRHPGTIRSTAISADGRVALAGGPGLLVGVWDPESGRQLAGLEGHVDLVRSVAISADGDVGASGGEDGVVRLWDLASRRCTLRCEPAGAIGRIAMSADGGVVISGGPGAIVRVWDLQNGRCARSLDDHRARICALALSANGRVALSAAEDGRALVWEPATARCLRPLEGHAGTILCAALSADGGVALSGGADGTVRVWDTETGRCLRTVGGHRSPVRSLAASADGRVALSGDEGGDVRIWTLAPGLRAPLSYARSRQASELVQAAVRVDDALARADRLLAENAIPAAAAALRTARGVPGHERHGGLLERWRRVGRAGRRSDLLGAWLRHDVAPDADDLRAVALSGDARVGIAGCGDGAVRTWDLETGRRLRVLTGHTGAICSVAISGDAGLSGSSDGTVRVWDLQSGRCRTFESGTKAIASLAVSADGRLAFAGCADRTVAVWDLDTGRRLHRLPAHPHPVTAIAVSADGATAVTSTTEPRQSPDPVVRVWDVAGGRCLRSLEGHGEAVSSVALTADGRTAVSAGNEVRIWDVASGRCLRILDHAPAARSLAVSRDGRFAVSGGAIGTLRVWDLATGRCLRTLAGHSRQVISVALSTDGRVAMSGAPDGTASVWELDWDYEFPEPADWDEGARPHVEAFCARHAGRWPGRGWSEEDFQHLLVTLADIGFGWLVPAGVRAELEQMTSAGGRVSRWAKVRRS